MESPVRTATQRPRRGGAVKGTHTCKDLDKSTHNEVRAECFAKIGCYKKKKRYSSVFSGPKVRHAYIMLPSLRYLLYRMLTCLDQNWRTLSLNKGRTKLFLGRFSWLISYVRWEKKKKVMSPKDPKKMRTPIKIPPSSLISLKTQLKQKFY